MDLRTHNLNRLLQVLFLTIIALEQKEVKNKSITKCIQLTKLKLFHRAISEDTFDNYLYISKVTKKNVKFKIILKLLFFSTFTDKLDHGNFKRSIVNYFRRITFLYDKHILSWTDQGFTKSSLYINTLTLVSLYTLYKLKYDLNNHAR